MKLSLLFLLLALTGCTIPAVGNSPEEIQHREQIETMKGTQ